MVSLSVSPSIVKIRVVGWWPLSLPPSILNIRPFSLCLLLYVQERVAGWWVAGWWSLSVSFYIQVRAVGWWSLSLSFYR